MKKKPDIETLTPADYNPRQAWAPEKASAFSRSLATFGDLGGIVKNLTTGNLVGGHKRLEEFRKAANFSIEKTTCKKDNQGTVAYGFCLADGNRFSYREVRWEIEKEKQANIAANQWTAEFNIDALAEILKDMLASGYFKSLEPERWQLAQEHASTYGYTLTAARNHTKIILMRIGTSHYVIESSSNLRSCRSIEQFAMTNSKTLFKFHEDWIRQAEQFAPE